VCEQRPLSGTPPVTLIAFTLSISGCRRDTWARLLQLSGLSETATLRSVPSNMVTKCGLRPNLAPTRSTGGLVSFHCHLSTMDSRVAHVLAQLSPCPPAPSMKKGTGPRGGMQLRWQLRCLHLPEPPVRGLQGDGGKQEI
jgi:hypothetical protein